MIRSYSTPSDPALALLSVPLSPLLRGRSPCSPRAVNGGRRSRLILRCTLSVILGTVLLVLPVPAAAQSPEVFFEAQVRPLLAERCYSCHGVLDRSELRVNSREALLEGGMSGPAIVPGDPDASLLIRSVRHKIEGQEMPQDGGPLSAHQIESLVEWIAMGAPRPVAEGGDETAGGVGAGSAASAASAMADERLTPGARLMAAVRLVERGVRILQVYCAKGDPWDAHTDTFQHRKNAKDSNPPVAALIKDLKSRGLFDETLVICGTEFGRTPVPETGGGGAAGRVANGRDRNPFGFSIWLAGGGIRGGMTYGADDEFGFKAVQNPLHVHDLHATILYLMGIDHERPTYRDSGRDFRLTDVHGHVIQDIIG